MSEVEQAELIHVVAETRRPMGRWGEVVQDEKATGSKQLDDPLGVVTLASAVAEEDIEGGVLLKQPPVSSEDADAVVVREDTSRSTGQLLVTLYGHQAGTGAKPTVQPGGTHARAGAALRNDSVGFRSSGQPEQPAHLRDATLLETRLGGDTLRGHHARRNRTLCHDHESPFTVDMTLCASRGVRTKFLLSRSGKPSRSGHYRRLNAGCCRSRHPASSGLRNDLEGGGIGFPSAHDLADEYGIGPTRAGMPRRIRSPEQLEEPADSGPVQLTLI